MIEVLELERSFGANRAVKEISFTGTNHSITGLLGVNGAGKSTTLRMIAGVLTPSSGCVEIDRIPMATNRIGAQMRLGALLDHAGLYPRLTARENMEYFARLRRVPEKVARQRADHWITALALNSVADRQTAGFSQGERMKVALGRLLLHSPSNLLLDEPTNGLDIPTVRKLRSILLELRDAGMCIVFASHVLEEVIALCDKIVIIADGVVAASGSTEGLCTDTRTKSLEEAFLTLTGSLEASRA